jgi:hypothetical protein
MIHYLVTGAHPYTIELFIAKFAPELRRWVKVLFYEELETLRELRAGTYIFSDIERLGRREAENAAKVWNALNGAPSAFRVLNHPTTSMKRYELLKSIQKVRNEAIYAYDVYRLIEGRAPRRFPVFVREENEHTGTRAEIRPCYSIQELDVEIERLTTEGRWRDNLIVVELVDTSDKQKIFRKYSAFVAHGRLFPEHVLFSGKWLVKVPVVVNRDTHAEQERYLQLNPHERELREVCALARIQYGRIDYAVKDGKLCIWEINTNPSLGVPMSDGDVDRTVEMLRWVNIDGGDVMVPNPTYGLFRERVKSYVHRATDRSIDLSIGLLQRLGM